MIRRYELSPYCYVLSHGYLCTIQVGIQSFHVGIELALRGGEDFMRWAQAIKAVKFLNGGTGDAFDANVSMARFLCQQHDLPFATFEEPDLKNITTACAFIITPEALEQIEYERMNLDDPNDHRFVDFLRRMPSAR